MRTIETIATVTAEHTLTIQLPPDIPPGDCRVVVVIENGKQTTGFTANWPVHDVGPWPEDLSLRREEMYGDDGR